MKIFISYRFSDIPKDELERLLDPVCKLFESHNVDVLCDFYKDDYYRDNDYTVRAIMEDCFGMLEQCDLVLCLVDTPRYSCGMLLEIGYALAKKKPIMVCSRKGCEIDTLCKMADENITYESYEELIVAIKEVFGL